MTRIWSGRQIDQVYAGMAERLVRQSNNARLDPNVGVNPRVRRILARMHRAGLLENMAGLWLPDMYTADGENRVERMGGLTARGALEQATVGDRPTLTQQSGFDGVDVLHTDGVSQHLLADGLTGIGSSLFSGISITTFVRRTTDLRRFIFGSANDGNTTAFWCGFNDNSSDQVAFFFRNDNNESMTRRTSEPIGINDGEWHTVTWRLNAEGNLPYMLVDGVSPSQSGAEAQSDDFSAFQYPPAALAFNLRGSIVNHYDGNLGALLVHEHLISPPQHAALHEILTETP